MDAWTDRFLLLKITEGAWTGNMELSAAQVPFNSGTIIWMHLVENLLGMVLISGFGGEDFITLTFNMPQPVYHCYVAAMMTLFWLRQWLIICTLRYSTWLAQKSVIDDFPIKTIYNIDFQLAIFDYQEVNHAHISWGVEELQVALRSMRIHGRVLHPNPVQQYRSGLICIESCSKQNINSNHINNHKVSKS